MISDRLEALLWARIDNSIDPQELAELEAHLAEHPTPREIEHQITAIADGLDRIEAVQPPPTLRARIEGALSRATPPVARPAATQRAASAPPWPARWLPVAASLLVGVAVGYLLNPATGGVDRLGVTGSMVTPTARPEVAPLEILLEDGAGSVVASRSGGDVVVDVTLNTETDLRATLAGATGGSVRLIAVTSTDGASTNVMSEDHWVALRTSGPGVMALSVSALPAGEVLRLQVSVDGAVIDERWIEP